MPTKNKQKFNQDIIVNFLKTYGFVFPSSEIYGGLANAWDYGPIGVLLKQNLKQLWWLEFCTKNPQAIGLDSAILMNPQVWNASGHVTNFSDPLIDCKQCHNRFRADKIIEHALPELKISEATPLNELYQIITKNNVTCPTCNKCDWTQPRKFNLMFKTYQGVTEDASTPIYLRPETAQGIFVNFHQIVRSTRMKLPFVVCQIGKAFRNEITPGNFIFRTREFEQMEMEYFCQKDDAAKLFELQVKKIDAFLTKQLKINPKNLRHLEHKKDELSHYSARTIDIQYNFCHGWGELWGIANRTNYDLTQHGNFSKHSLTYFDIEKNQHVIPYVVEPSVGCDRLLYALFIEHYDIEKLKNDETREVLHLPVALCPYKIAILPLANKLNSQAKRIYLKLLEKGISCNFDTSGSIGKRYRRQDAIGTMYCLTYDFESTKNKTFTIRNRDTMRQKRLSFDQLMSFLEKNL